ncbi:MAG: hypothetical protein N2738_06930 [Thermodesulfovibrionales bacterium]|nr:hypothetical protein [Thermodesulfovibrionales bacterium]
MTNEEFEIFLKQVFKDIEALALLKKDEYSIDNNRFHNFKAQAFFCNTSMIGALRGNWAKHIISIRDMLNNTVDKSYSYPYKLWQEKLYDNILYSVLCLAMIKER